MARVRRYVLLSGWLTERLTGEWVDSTACQVGYLPFDYQGLSGRTAREWKWRAAVERD